MNKFGIFFYAFLLHTLDVFKKNKLFLGFYTKKDNCYRLTAVWMSFRLCQRLSHEFSQLLQNFLQLYNIKKRDQWWATAVKVKNNYYYGYPRLRSDRFNFGNYYLI